MAQGARGSDLPATPVAVAPFVPPLRPRLNGSNWRLATGDWEVNEK
jgi:hypothetical protein